MTDTTTETTSEQARNSRRVLEGIVSSDAMDKSITVRVERKFKHPKYKKYVKERLRYKAHDEQNDCKVGDKVLLEETRPLSKDKRWRVKEILERAPLA